MDHAAYTLSKQLAARVPDERVLEAIDRVPRHEFVPPALRHRAYDNVALPIAFGQTISQPLVVALMTELAKPRADSKALDVGTGTGYQAAVLAELVQHVYSIEVLEPLAEEARERLDQLGYHNVTVRTADGYAGWPEEAPFDVIVVAAAPAEVPGALVDQLASPGRMVLPVGVADQELVVVEKDAGGVVRQRRVGAVAFVPMVSGGEG